MPSPEILAESLLAKGVLQQADILRLYAALPSEVVTRNTTETEGRAFGVGAWIHGGVGGLRQNTHLFPLTCKVLCAFVRQRCANHNFSSPILLENSQAGLHTDSHNDASSLLP